MLSKIQKQKIIKNLTWKNLAFFLLWVIIFSWINFYFNDIKTLWFWFMDYKNSVKIPYIVSMILNSFLVALSINLLIDKMKEIKSMNPSAWIFSMFWTFFALLTWACPWCIAWIFPLFVWLFGSNLSMYSLPLHWVELQILSFVFLVVWVYFLSKDMTCNIKKKKKWLIQNKPLLIKLVVGGIILLTLIYWGYLLYESLTAPAVFWK